jgi:hypothetical protein
MGHCRRQVWQKRSSDFARNSKPLGSPIAFSQQGHIPFLYLSSARTSEREPLVFTPIYVPPSPGRRIDCSTYTYGASQPVEPPQSSSRVDFCLGASQSGNKAYRNTSPRDFATTSTTLRGTPTSRKLRKARWANNIEIFGLSKVANDYEDGESLVCQGMDRAESDAASQLNNQQCLQIVNTRPYSNNAHTK